MQERERLLVQQGPHDTGLRVDHDFLSVPVPDPGQVSQHRRRRRLGPSVQPGLGHGDLQGGLAGQAGDVHHPARCPGVNVDGRPSRAGTPVAERRDRAIDDPRVVLGHLVVANAALIEVLLAPRLDHEICLADQVTEQQLPVQAVEIQGHRPFPRPVRGVIKAALGARHAVQEWAHATGAAASGRLDFDDIGAELSKHAPGYGATLVGQVENPELREDRKPTVVGICHGISHV